MQAFRGLCCARPVGFPSEPDGGRGTLGRPGESTCTSRGFVRQRTFATVVRRGGVPRLWVRHAKRGYLRVHVMRQAVPCPLFGHQSGTTTSKATSLLDHLFPLLSARGPGGRQGRDGIRSPALIVDVMGVCDEQPPGREADGSSTAQAAECQSEVVLTGFFLPARAANILIQFKSASQ